jgi:cell division septation protein DedD
MKRIILGSSIFAVAFMLFTAAAYQIYAQEASNTNLILVPSQERKPQVEQPRIPPELIIPPIESPPPSSAERKGNVSPAVPHVSQNSPPFKAPLITSLERGKWYVQIGVYTMAGHVENAINRAGKTSPVVVQNVGTNTKPMFRVLLGPFSQNESKTMLQRFRNKGYEAFLRKG